MATQEPAAVSTLQAAFARSWEGSTPEAFDAEVRVWLEAITQPKFGVPYRELVYRPMLELVRFLTASDFRVFVCSGGGRDFMRVFAEETWGIHKENVIGTAADYRYVDGHIVRGSETIGGLNFGPGKPEHIFAQTGRLPAFAAGNGDIDIEMLDSAAFALFIVHDDDEREFAYMAGAETALAHAGEAGWTVVSMLRDWNTVFGPLSTESAGTESAGTESAETAASDTEAPQS